MSDRVPKRVKMPWRPILGYGIGQVVQDGPGSFWVIDRATIEGTGHSSNVYLYLSPLNPQEVLNGIGELRPDRIIHLPVTKRENLLPNPSFAVDARGWLRVNAPFPPTAGLSVADGVLSALVDGDVAGAGVAGQVGETVYAGQTVYGRARINAAYDGDDFRLRLGTDTDFGQTAFTSSTGQAVVEVEWTPRRDYERGVALSVVSFTLLPSTMFVAEAMASRYGPGFVDGRSVGMAWLGEPDFSVSRET